MSNPHVTDSALTWRKSTRSSGGGNECVEVADLGTGTAVRDSKNPTGGVLAFDRSEWRAFTARIRSGDLS
jgi:uncharacterized protein DUF397